MERVLSADERIKRAEEIYYRRKMLSGSNDVARVNVGDNKRNFGLLKKTMLQIAICIVIYLIIHLVQTTNYVFSQDFLGKAKEILSYDVNFQEIYNSSLGYINGLWIKNNKELSKENEEQTGNEDEQKEQEEIIETTSEEQELENITTTEEENIENLSQEEQDIKYVLENVPMIKPLARYNYIKVWTKRI